LNIIEIGADHASSKHKACSEAENERFCFDQLAGLVPVDIKPAENEELRGFEYVENVPDICRIPAEQCASNQWAASASFLLPQKAQRTCSELTTAVAPAVMRQ